MAATGLQMNTRNVGFTPTSGTLVTYTKVDGISFDGGGSVQKYSGDGDRFITTIVNDFSEPTVMLETSNLALATSVSIGTTGVLTWTNKDARNQGASGASGDMVWTMQSMVETITASGRHRQFATANVKFTGYSLDGLTPPMSLTITA